MCSSDLGAITQALGEIAGVTAVRDLHVWGASTSETSLTVHLVIPDAALHEAALAAAKTLLHDRFGIDHTTIQIERVGQASACQK